MKQLTNNFKTTLAQLTFNEIASSNTYYFAVAQSQSSNTTPTDTSVSSMLYGLDKQILYGNKITPSSIALTALNNPWVQGTIYNMYDDSVADLSNFYVVVDEADGTKSIFKCLKNKKSFVNGIATVLPSTVSPSKTFTSSSNMIYKAADGYIWKYMYNISTADVLKFCGPSFVSVKQESAVSNNAVSGSIDVIDVKSSGSNFNKFAYASIAQANFGGNPLKYRILPTEFSNVYEFSSNTLQAFTVNSNIEFISANTTIATGTVYNVSSTSLKVITTYNQNLSTPITIKQSPTVSQSFSGFNKTTVPNISVDVNAYQGFTLYVRSGTGAGQYNVINNYDASNNQFVVTTQTPFTLTLDTTSKVEILPTISINGDGTSAFAIANIDSITNSIVDIDVVNRGQGYTYASAAISGNTSYINYLGQTISPTTPSFHPIISPIGGHGFNCFHELNCNGVCVTSVLDANTPVRNSYSKIAIINDTSLANTNYFSDIVQANLTVNYPGINNTGFQVGEIVTQGKAKATVFSANTSVIELSNVYSSFSANNGPIVGQTTQSIGVIQTPSSPTRIKGKLNPLYVEDLTNAINRDMTNDTIKINIQF